MPKVRLFDERAVATARRTLASAGVGHAHAIEIEAIAGELGVLVLYRRHDTARATIVRSGSNAIICIDERLEGRPVARFAVAHELAHFRSIRRSKSARRARR
jgi:hypothetical protein